MLQCRSLFTIHPTANSIPVISAVLSSVFTANPCFERLFIRCIPNAHSPPVAAIVQCVQPRQIISAQLYPAAPMANNVIFLVLLNNVIRPYAQLFLYFFAIFSAISFILPVLCAKIHCKYLFEIMS